MSNYKHQKFNYGFVVKTNQYSGSFEREMCGYITGTYGDCEVGQSYARCFSKEVGNSEGLFDNVVYLADMHGSLRPVSMYGQTGIIIFFNRRPSKKQIKIMQDRAIKFYEVWRKIMKEFYTIDVSPIKIKGFSIIKQVTTYDEEYL